MRLALLEELKEIYGHFVARKDMFPHVRQDSIERRIVAGQCVYQEGVVITFQKYLKATRIGTVLVPKGAIMLHQIVNGQQYSGAGSRVFEEFFRDTAVATRSDLYLCVRKDNEVACAFYRRRKMTIVGTVDWSAGALPGLVFRRRFWIT